MPSLVTVDAVRDQLIQLGRDDIDDETIETFLASARKEESKWSETTSTSTIAHLQPAGDVRARRRPPWNGDAFEEPTTTPSPSARYRELPRRQRASSVDRRRSSWAGRCEDGVVDAVRVGQLYRSAWASESSPFVVSGRERPREGFAEKFKAMHAKEEERVRRFRMRSARGPRREPQDFEPAKVSLRRGGCTDTATRRRTNRESDAGDGEDSDGDV